jgi:hypothetical protein
VARGVIGPLAPASPERKPSIADVAPLETEPILGYRRTILMGDFRVKPKSGPFLSPFVEDFSVVPRYLFDRDVVAD